MPASDGVQETRVRLNTVVPLQQGKKKSAHVKFPLLQLHIDLQMN